MEKFSPRVGAAAPLQFAALTYAAAPTRESQSLIAQTKQGDGIGAETDLPTVRLHQMCGFYSR